MTNSRGTALVIGGGGFIGSHTADALSEEGYSVRVFDKVPSPYLNTDAGQEMILGDLSDYEVLLNAAKGVDYIYHFAGIADIEEANSRPLDVCDINIKGTVQALEIAKQVGVKRFIFASTVYVYSDRGGFYRVSKQACENFIEAYQRLYNLPFTILRYGSLYGRRAGPDNGIRKIIETALTSNKVTYNGDPNATREYIHANDAARLSVQILDSKFENKHIILTGHERMKVSDLMLMISEMLPHNPEVEFGEKTLAAHYVMTPYLHNPRLGEKLIDTRHIDLGQGLLDCIDDVHQSVQPEKKVL